MSGDDGSETWARFVVAATGVLSIHRVKRALESAVSREITTLKTRYEFLRDREAEKQAVIEAAQAKQRSPQAKKPRSLAVLK